MISPKAALFSPQNFLEFELDTVLLLAWSQDWTCNLQMIVSLEAWELTVTLCV